MRVRVVRALLSVLSLVSLPIPAQAQSGIISTVAGAYPLGDGGPARTAALQAPRALAVDQAGNLYLLDDLDFRIRKITPGGVITTVVGMAQGVQFGGCDHFGLAFDREGALYFTEGAYHRVRKLTPAGIIATVGGTGVAGFSGDGGPATAAQFNYPVGLAMDADGNLYVSDAGNHRIRRISPAGIVSTVAGTGASGYAGDSGQATAAQIAGPSGLATDAGGNLYIADPDNGRVRKVARSDVITTVAGGGSRPTQDGLTATEVSLPRLNGGLAADSSGNLYITTDTRIFKVTVGGVLSVVAGTGEPGHSGDGGPATAANLRAGWGIALDQAGNLYRSDNYGRVRRVDTSGTMDTIAGVGVFYGDGGPAVFSTVAHPWSVAVDPSGNVFTATQGVVRKITPAGTISQFAGTPDRCVTPSATEPIPAATACLSPMWITTDATGHLYVFGGDRIFQVTPEGMATLVPGAVFGTFRVFDGGHVFQGLAVDAAGNIYVTDSSRHRILKAPREGSISVAAGTGAEGFSGDGGPATRAQLRYPRGIAVDASGNLYIADSGNYRIRKVTPSGSISTVAGTGQPGVSGDGGSALQADLGTPVSLDVDAAGNLYIPVESRIRQVTPGGIITTIAGDGRWGFSGDGGPAIRASLTAASDVSGDANGNVYFADFFNNRIRRVQGSAPYQIEPGGLVFSYPLGAPAARQLLAVSSPDRETRRFAVTSSTNWLSAAPASGTVGATGVVSVAVSANPAGLGKGTYNGRLTFSTPGTDERLVVPVTMTISGTPQQLRLSQTGLTFAAVGGGSAPPPQSFRVLNAGLGSMNWTISTSTLAGGPGWLAAPGSGRSDAGAVPPSVEVRVNPAGLAAGSYSGLVTVNASGVDNSPQSAAVLLVVYPADNPPGPVVEPLGLIFTGAPGGANPAPQNVQLWNVTTRAVQFTSTTSLPDGSNWFNYSPASGTIAAGQAQRIDILAKLQGLAAGVYRGELTLRFQPDNLTTRISLLLVVAPGAGKSAGKGTPPRADGQCTPSRLLPVFRSPGQDFAVTAGWPVSVQVEVVDNCGLAMNTGQVVVSFSNNAPAVALQAVGEGRWTGTWASRNPSTGVDLTVRAQMLEPRLEGEAKIRGGVRENLEQPVIAPGGVLNAASFRREAPLAPGSYLSIFGSKLAKQTKAADSLPLPVELGDTVAAVAGRPLPLHFTSDGQVNAIMPYAIADNTRHQLIVRKGTSYSLPEPVLVATSEPAVFTVDGSGSGQGHIYVATEAGLKLADASRPARPGEGLVIYATGLGPVAPGVREGEPAAAEPLSRTVTPVQVTIQGKSADVFFAGLAPGMAGIYQVNVLVPAGVKADASAVVVLSVGEQSSSPPVAMAVTPREEENQ